MLRRSQVTAGTSREPKKLKEPPHSYGPSVHAWWRVHLWAEFTLKLKVFGHLWQQWCLVPNNNAPTDGAQRAVREKEGKNSNLSPVRAGFQPRGLIVRTPQILTSFLAACPARRCVCVLWSEEKCVWCEREEVIRVRVVTQNFAKWGVGWLWPTFAAGWRQVRHEGQSASF